MEIETEKRKYIGIKNRGMGWDELLVVFLVFQTPPERMQSYFLSSKRHKRENICWVLDLHLQLSKTHIFLFPNATREKRAPATLKSQTSPSFTIHVYAPPVNAILIFFSLLLLAVASADLYLESYCGLQPQLQ